MYMQSISHKMDYDDEREDRIKALERIEEMKKQDATVSGSFSTFFSRQFWGKKQHLKDCQQKVSHKSGNLYCMCMVTFCHVLDYSPKCPY